MSPLTNVQRRSLERAASTYENYVEEAEEYLAGRGISLADARTARLGVVRDPIPGHEGMVGRLAIPYLTRAGVVHMNFRCTRDHICKTVPKHPKYTMFRGAGVALFNMQAIHDAGQSIAIAEGEISAWSSTKAGVPCVATSGADKFPEHWKLIFEDFSSVYYWKEADDGGKTFEDKVRSIIPTAIRIELPSGEDPNTLWVKGGAQAIRELVRK